MEQEIRSLFVMLDTEATGSVDISRIGFALNALGFSVSQKNIESICSSYGMIVVLHVLYVTEDKIRYREFKEIMVAASEMTEPFDEAELIQAFKTFDRKNLGKLMGPELKYYLTQLGDKISEDDANILMNILTGKPDPDTVPIEKSTSILMSFLHSAPDKREGLGKLNEQDGEAFEASYGRLPAAGSGEAGGE